MQWLARLITNPLAQVRSLMRAVGVQLRIEISSPSQHFLFSLGSPTPEVMWQFNGRLLHPSGKFRISATSGTHTLTVFQVTSKDLGCYSCRITNKLVNSLCVGYIQYYEVSDISHFFFTVNYYTYYIYQNNRY